MRRLPTYRAGLVLTWALMTGVSAHAAERVERPGAGPAYDRLGHVAVMHAGRVKPLDTVARQEIKQIYGRETIRIRDFRAEVESILNPNVSRGEGPTRRKTEEWGPVCLAFVGWTVRPAFWDGQPFILVDDLPLRRAILAGTIESRLEAIAEKSTTPSEERARLRSLAVEPTVTAEQLAAFLRGSTLPMPDRETIAWLAARLTRAHRWLSPRELEEARMAGREGSPPVPFLAWATEASEKKERFDANPRSVERPTEIERRGIEVARRLLTYQAYSGERLSAAGIILIQPRPANTKYLSFTTRVYKDALEKRSTDHLQPMQADALDSLLNYWRLVPREDQRTPGEDAAADAKFTAWLRGAPPWVPLRVLLRENAETLAKAGYPERTVRVFLEAYRQLERDEGQAPGGLSEATASRFLEASRALGESVSGRYPPAAAIARETRFNTLNPFGLAPFAYGAGLVLLVLSLTVAQAAPGASLVGVAGRGLYRLGLTAVVSGIVLELIGFYLRVRISGWAPVTNMYETVVWVALVAAILSLVFEVIFRAVFMALAGAAVALVCTWTAASVSLLDPSIRSLQPVLRDNFWLGTHVLVVVSSYAAFGLAWVLGLIATLYFLTAPYRRTPRVGELMRMLIPGLPLLSAGGAGVAASYGLFGPRWTMGDSPFYLFAVLAWFGGILSLAAVLAVIGEWVARTRFAAEPRSKTLDTAAGAGQPHAVAVSAPASAPPLSTGGVASRVKPSVAEIRKMEAASRIPLDARAEAIQRTTAQVKPLVNFIYRAMQVGVLLIAAGTIQGGVWADYSWGRFWGWDAKEVWALTTLIVYLIPLHGRFAGWVNTFWLAFASVFCFLSVVMAWYGVNFVLGVGLHSYGFVEGGSQGVMSLLIAVVLAWPVAAAWRRFLASGPIGTVR